MANTGIPGVDRDMLSRLMAGGTWARNAGKNTFNAVRSGANAVYNDPVGSAKAVGKGLYGIGEDVGRAAQGAATASMYGPTSDTPNEERDAYGKLFVEGPLNLAGAATPFATKGSAGIFGGKLTPGADHMQLTRAEHMTRQGATPDQIWKDTGWYQHPVDKQWRFEISDHKARANDSVPVGPDYKARVDDVLDHPDLYKAQPDIAERPVQLFTSTDGTQAYYSRGKDEFGLGLNNQSLAKSTTNMLHELQHGMQKRNEFARGGSPEMFNDTKELAKAYRAALSAQIHASTSMIPWGDPLKRAAHSVSKDYPGVPWESVYDAAKNKSQSELMELFHQTDPYSRYSRQAGEVEARNVEKRWDFTPEERRKWTPWQTQDTAFDLQTAHEFPPGTKP